MPAISQTTFLLHFLELQFYIVIRISHKFVPKCQIDNKGAFVQVIAWCRIGDKPMSEPKLIQFTDDYMRHQGADENLNKGSMSLTSIL